LFEYAHITTLFKINVDIKNLDQDVLKQDAVYLQKDIIDEDNDEDNKIVDINHNVLKIIENEDAPQNNAIVATNIIK